jgi:hypothetical protein
VYSATRAFPYPVHSFAITCTIPVHLILRSDQHTHIQTFKYRQTDSHTHTIHQHQVQLPHARPLDPRPYTTDTTTRQIIPTAPTHPEPRTQTPGTQTKLPGNLESRDLDELQIRLTDIPQPPTSLHPEIAMS